MPVLKKGINQVSADKSDVPHHDRVHRAAVRLPHEGRDMRISMQQLGRLPLEIEKGVVAGTVLEARKSGRCECGEVRQ